MNYSIEWDGPGERDSDMDLLPCPFCGADAEIIECDEPSNKGGTAVQCTRLYGIKPGSLLLQGGWDTPRGQRVERASGQLSRLTRRQARRG